MKLVVRDSKEEEREELVTARDRVGLLEFLDQVRMQVWLERGAQPGHLQWWVWGQNIQAQTRRWADEGWLCAGASHHIYFHREAGANSSEEEGGHVGGMGKGTRSRHAGAGRGTGPTAGPCTVRRALLAVHKRHAFEGSPAARITCLPSNSQSAAWE